MKFKIKITLPDGSSMSAKCGSKVQTWDDAGAAEARALWIRDHSPRGTMTKVLPVA